MWGQSESEQGGMRREICIWPRGEGDGPREDWRAWDDK
jgi:hypothetical protein